MIEGAIGLRPRFSARQTILVIASLILLAAAVRIPLLNVPLERDEGEYAYIAWRLGHNELPYRDWVDQKPPAIFWVYRAALALPLGPIRAVHFAALLFAAASSCALFFLALRFMNRFWAFAAAALFTLLSADPFAQGTAANTELFMLLPLILSQIAFLKAADNPRNILSMLLCGALTGIAIAFKQVAAVNWFLLIALYPIFAASEKRWRNAVTFAIWSLGGLFAISGIIALYFWTRHGLSALIGNVFTHNLEYIGAMTWSDRLQFCAETLTRLARTETVVWIFAAAGLIALIVAGKGKWFLFFAGWLITSMIGVSASGYFFPHYFQQLLPPLALTGVLGAQWLSELRPWRSSWIPRALFGLLLVVLPLKVLWPFWFSYTPADAVRTIYPGNFFAEMPEFAARIAQVTSPEQRVFVFGAEPELLFYAHRVSATRYIFLFPLFGPYRNAREKQIAAADEIQRATPAAAIYVPNDLFFNPGSDQYFTDWSLSYLQQNFYPDTWLIKQSPTTAQILRAEPNSPEPERFLGAILVKKASAP
ncbi:MAG TPA: glycosyltransferase family 39 protein [Chthoniobacterales bacterium]|nr:glycosyltransferase family 39 protein [Chthoniobacterales bacterium]